MASSKYQYRVIPLETAVVSAKANDLKVLCQTLEKQFHDASNQGWEFQSIESISVIQNPGCLNALFGGKSTSITYDVIVFRKEI